MSRHLDWLQFIEASGPFLTTPVLDRVFPQGLDAIDRHIKGNTRAAYEEWRSAIESGAADGDALHREWLRFVLRQVLEYSDAAYCEGDRIDKALIKHVPEHRTELRPDAVIISPQGRPDGGTAQMLIMTYPAQQDLDAGGLDGWQATPIERITQLCRLTGVRLGLITNGATWMLVDAQVGKTATYAPWQAELWSAEVDTLRAFCSLLAHRRFFGVAPTDTLVAMLDESVQHQNEVTDQLGRQVHRAVEVLIQALDRADEERNRELLAHVLPERLYEASLTFMMRLVFLFCAEERGLLLLNNPLYDASYAASKLRAKLRKDAERHGEQVLERRQDAYSRLLAVFRAVYDGIEHDELKLTALGGTLFAPDRFPFLEGRPRESTWRDTPADPLPVSNLTVLHLLESLQVLQLKKGGAAQTLSFRALDVEQIGHVYEGLLEYKAAKVDKTTLHLKGAANRHPEMILQNIESAAVKGAESLVNKLREVTGRTTQTLSNALEQEAEVEQRTKLLTVCHGDQELFNRVLPFHAIIEDDVWGYPQIYREDSYMLVHGADRRDTGSHYTPKVFTEAIVEETLEPVVYEGPAEGVDREDWKLKSPAQLLDLKVCDMAVGSGAFLVQTCRWLAERLVEAWQAAEKEGQRVDLDGQVVDELGGEEAMPLDPEERRMIARRLIAERCLYGVDMNPLAVELAKLSIWLVTLAKDRPFGFLDHNLRHGDSLLGITSLKQLTKFHIDPKTGKGLPTDLFEPEGVIRAALDEALEKRGEIRRKRILDLDDVRDLVYLDREAKAAIEPIELAADVLVGAALDKGKGPVLNRKLFGLADEVGRYLSGEEGLAKSLRAYASKTLAKDMKAPRRSFHWAIEFPEVFENGEGGFDAIVGNPPFLGGQRITGVMGTAFRDYLVEWIASGKRGSADLVAYFFLRAYRILRDDGQFELIAVNTIAEGNTRDVGLQKLVELGAQIIAAHPNEKWPGQAAVITSRVLVRKGDWSGARRINGCEVNAISTSLSEGESWKPKKLKANQNLAFQGSIILGDGFTLDSDVAEIMLADDPKNAEVIYPYMNGKDLNSDSLQRPSRWVINFWDWSKEKASEYRMPFDQVEREVKPGRLINNDEGAKENWWLFLRARPELYHAIGRGKLFEKHPTTWRREALPAPIVLGIATGATKYPTVCALSNDVIWAHAVCIIVKDTFADLAIFASSAHDVWAWEMGSRLKTDLRYTHGSIIGTFPFPTLDTESTQELNELGESLHAVRRQICAESQIGLTKLYNQFHDPSVSGNLERLREIHCEIDAVVCAAYGWGDLDLSFGLHARPEISGDDNIRFGLPNELRTEVVSRLRNLNRVRFEEEQDSISKTSTTTRRKVTSKKRGARKKVVATRFVSNSAIANQSDLFGSPAEQESLRSTGNQWGATALDQIEAWLEDQATWRAEVMIIRGCGCNPDEFEEAINQLIDEGYVESRETPYSKLYRAKE